MYYPRASSVKMVKRRALSRTLDKRCPKLLLWIHKSGRTRHDRKDYRFQDIFVI